MSECYKSRPPGLKKCVFKDSRKRVFPLVLNHLQRRSHLADANFQEAKRFAPTSFPANRSNRQVTAVDRSEALRHIRLSEYRIVEDANILRLQDYGMESCIAPPEMPIVIAKTYHTLALHLLATW